MSKWIQDRPVSLGAMSDSQRRLVSEHFRLVYLAIGRFNRPEASGRPGWEFQDLRQEGFIALSDAVRNHDPTRHGDFAPYALSRIRHAVSRFAHEFRLAIRIPYITQRRRKQRLRQKQFDKARPDRFPRLVKLNCDRHSPSHWVSRRLYAESLDSPAESTTIGDLIRVRILNAADRATRRMKQTPGASAGRAQLIETCLDERWTIPDEGARTPIRQLARSLGCSLGRITHNEGRFHALMAEDLRSDPVLGALRRLARSCDAGFRHRLQHDEIVRLQCSTHAPTRTRT